MRTLVLLSLAVLGLGACSGAKEVAETPKSLKVTSAAEKSTADGTWVKLSLEAVDGLGAPGTGSVEVKATHGAFRGFKGSASVVLEAGKGAIEYRCDVADDEMCIGGTQVVVAKWRSLAAYTTVEFTEAK